MALRRVISFLLLMLLFTFFPVTPTSRLRDLFT